MHLGTRTSLTELLAKFDSIYGPSKSKKRSVQSFTIFLSYASKGICKSERNYPAHKLEFLALKWAITEKFSDYLYGHTFTVYTTTIHSHAINSKTWRHGALLVGCTIVVWFWHQVSPCCEQRWRRSIVKASSSAQVTNSQGCVQFIANRVLHGMPYSLSKGDSNYVNCFGRTVLYMCLLYLG